LLNHADEKRDDWALAVAFGLILGALAGAALFKIAHMPDEPTANAGEGSNTQYPDQ